MSSVAVRNLPEDTHRALRVRAALHGRSTAAEIRDILENIVRPEGRVKLGSLVAVLNDPARHQRCFRALESGCRSERAGLD